MISKVVLYGAKLAARKLIPPAVRAAKRYTPETVKFAKEQAQKGYKMGRYLWMEGGKRLIPVK